MREGTNVRRSDHGDLLGPDARPGNAAASRIDPEPTDPPGLDRAEADNAGIDRAEADAAGIDT